MGEAEKRHDPNLEKFKKDYERDGNSECCTLFRLLPYRLALDLRDSELILP
jgi:hypothetical protein